MNRWIARSLPVGTLAAGALLFCGTAAHADSNSAHNFGIANGNQISIVIQAPVVICGNAIAIFGSATAHCGGGASASAGGSSAGQGNAAGSGHHHRYRHR
jgi:hypothetical protein